MRVVLCIFGKCIWVKYKGICGMVVIEYSGVNKYLDGEFDICSCWWKERKFEKKKRWLER